MKPSPFELEQPRSTDEAVQLLAAANVISGRLDGFEALSLEWSDGFDEARPKVAAALERLDQGQGVLILTDMYGGTPCNVALTFYEAGKVEVLTGVNLPVNGGLFISF